MGANQSSSSSSITAQKTAAKLEETIAASKATVVESSSATMATTKVATVVSEEPPSMNKVETFEQKLFRKFSSEPLVPIGCVVTAWMLGSGIRSFYNRDPIKSQKFMRLRVASQFATLSAFVFYYGYSSFNLDFAPGYDGMMQPENVVPTTTTTQNNQPSSSVNNKNDNDDNN